MKKLAGVFRSLSGSLAVVGLGLAVLDGLAIEPNLLRVRWVRVPANCCTEQLARLRLAHLSDIHVMGRGWRPGTIASAIQACNRADVDLVAMTGDFIGSGTGARAAIKMLSELRTDVPRVAVLGNHDHVSGKRYLDILLDGLRELGIIVLRNEALPLELPSGRIWVAGVDDGYSMRDDLGAALRSLGPDDFPRILLTHYPEVAEQLRPGQAQLSLAGHSHAGQVRVPILASLVHNSHARTKYGKGLFLVNGNPLYVSPGVGMSGVPMRFRNPPEVPLIGFAVGRPSGRPVPTNPCGREQALPVQHQPVAARRPGAWRREEPGCTQPDRFIYYPRDRCGSTMRLLAGAFRAFGPRKEASFRSAD